MVSFLSRVIPLCGPHVHFRTDTELCLHRFYGGNGLTNFGGVCHDEGTKRELAFDYETSAPVFTSDVDVPPPISRIWLPWIERLCRGRCWCSEEDRKLIVENMSLRQTALDRSKRARPGMKSESGVQSKDEEVLKRKSLRSIVIMRNMSWRLC